MKAEKKWQKRLAATILGAVIAGMPLFAVQAEEATFSREGQRYDVRRGMYEKDDGSDEHVRLGQYADEKHQEARDAERREDLAKRQAEDREAFEKRQAEERKEFEKQQAEERGERREEPRNEANETKEAAKESRGEQREQREYRYDVRRGMYEQEGGSDTEVRRGQYEQPSEDGGRRGLVR